MGLKITCPHCGFAENLEMYELLEDEDCALYYDIETCWQCEKKYKLVVEYSFVVECVVLTPEEEAKDGE